jgi:hypothetical protein
MAFRLRKDTKKWFKHIEKELPLGFDMYYLCLMAGLASGRKEDVAADDATDLVNDFPREYRSKGRIIIALFLSRELKALGIRLSERSTLHSEIQKLIDPLSSSHLTDIGMKEINRYSFGGFDVLTEWFQDQPRNIETFLPLYKQRLDETLEANNTL